MMAGGHGVAPSYVNLESTRSHIDPPPWVLNYRFNRHDVKLNVIAIVFS